MNGSWNGWQINQNINSPGGSIDTAPTPKRKQR
jgi:hypothetical protein